MISLAGNGVERIRRIYRGRGVLWGAAWNSAAPNRTPQAWVRRLGEDGALLVARRASARRETVGARKACGNFVQFQRPPFERFSRFSLQTEFACKNLFTSRDHFEKITGYSFKVSPLVKFLFKDDKPCSQLILCPNQPAHVFGQLEVIGRFFQPPCLRRWFSTISSSSPSRLRTRRSERSPGWLSVGPCRACTC